MNKKEDIQMEKKYAIAFDLGGTKIDTLIVSSDGEVIKRVSAAGGTPFDHGVKITFERCFAALDELIDNFPHKIESIYASIATVEYYIDEFIAAFKEKYGHITDKIRIEGDGCCLISAALGHNDGACMICGTGSALYMREGDSYKHIGGGGFYIDSCGSGFALGRKALQACLRADDGSTDKTVLCELIQKQAGGRPWSELLPKVYAEGRAYVASFAGAVFEARKLGDVTARRIFNTCASDIADVIWAARKEIGHGFSIAFNGGIFSHFPEYAEAVRALAPSDINVVYTSLTPVFGCAIEALHDAGIKVSVGGDFESRFAESYAEVSKK